MANCATCQVFTTLHDFSAPSGSAETNLDGAAPQANLVISGNILYGTTKLGGQFGNGALFRVNLDGSAFTNLHSFSAFSSLSENSDGANPQSALILFGGALYGTAASGGLFGSGTVFSLDTNGLTFTNLHDFSSNSYNPQIGSTNSDGFAPYAALVSAGNQLFGTTYAGGTNGFGTLFSLNPDGTGFTNLHTFSDSDGTSPVAALTVSGTNLYGTTAYAGNGFGTIFGIHTDGSGFTNLYNFSDPRIGAQPSASLILSGNRLYGTTVYGGSMPFIEDGFGTVFEFNLTNSTIANLHTFALPSGPYPGPFVNSDGAYPEAGLLLSGNTLYGTANGGGQFGSGTLFSISTDGSDFSTLYNFALLSNTTPAINRDGANASASLIPSGNSLYGTTYDGGFYGGGTVFCFTIEPQLSITLSGTNAILSWPVNVGDLNFTGFTLQSTSNLNSSTIWQPVSPSATLVNGQFTVTNSISPTQIFYRLQQQ